MREQDDVQEASVEFEPVPLLVDELCVASRTARRMSSPLFRYGKSVRRVANEFVRNEDQWQREIDVREKCKVATSRARSCRLSS